MMHELIANSARLDHGGPADDKGQAVAAFPDIEFVAAQRTAGVVSLRLQLLRAHVRSEAVIAGEKHERVRGLAGLFDRIENLADGGIGLENQISAVIVEPALAAPGGIDGEGCVRSGQGKIKQIGLWVCGEGFDAVAGALGEGGQDVFQIPVRQGGTLTAGLIVGQIFLR